MNASDFIDMMKELFFGSDLTEQQAIDLFANHRNLGGHYALPLEGLRPLNQHDEALLNIYIGTNDRDAFVESLIYGRELANPVRDMWCNAILRPFGANMSNSNGDPTGYPNDDACEVAIRDLREIAGLPRH